MLQMLVLREVFTEKATAGRLFLNGKFAAFTLEDIVRPKGVSIPGNTAIPDGTYSVRLSLSKFHSEKRMKKLQTPLLENVPDCVGVRIHGDFASDEGSVQKILVGNRIDLKKMKLIESAEPEVTAALHAQDGLGVITVVNNNKMLAAVSDEEISRGYRI